MFDQVHTATDESDPEEYLPGVPAEDPVPDIARSLAMPEEDVRTMTEKIIESIKEEHEAKEQMRLQDVALAMRGVGHASGSSRAAAHRGQKQKALSKRRAAKKAAKR